MDLTGISHWLDFCFNSNCSAFLKILLFKTFFKGKENRTLSLSLISLIMPFSSWSPPNSMPTNSKYSQLNWMLNFPAQWHKRLCQSMSLTYTVLYKGLGKKQGQSNPYFAELPFGFAYINWITNGLCIFTVFLIPCTGRLEERGGMHTAFSLSKRNLQQKIDLINVFCRKHMQNVL